jgi:hypothetical protein
MTRAMHIPEDNVDRVWNRIHPPQPHLVVESISRSRVTATLCTAFKFRPSVLRGYRPLRADDYDPGISVDWLATHLQWLFWRIQVSVKRTRRSTFLPLIVNFST